MAEWIFFVLIAELMWAFTSLFDKVLLSKGYIKSPFVFIVFNGAMNLLLVFLLPFFSFEPLKLADLLIVLFAGFMLSSGVLIYYMAAQNEEISRVVMLLQIIPIFVLLLSFFFLDEILTKNNFIGFLFLLAAGIIVSYKRINGSFHISKAFYLMLGSTFMISIYYVLSKHVYNVTSFWSAFMWLRVGSFAGLFVLLSSSVRKQLVITLKEMEAKARALLTFKMVIDFSAFIFLGYALLKGPVSLVSALGSATTPMFIFIITLFTSLYLPKIVKEEVNKRAVLTKLLAIVLIITGIIFIGP